MNNKFIFLFGFLLLFSSVLVSAAPPFESTIITDKAIQLEVPVIGTLQAEEDFKFHIHPYNSTDGLFIPQGDIDVCMIHIYRPSNGGHIIEANMTPDGNGVDWEYEVLGGNFTELGQYVILLYCEVEDDIGGFFEYNFEVTSTGEPTNNTQLYSRIFLILLSLALIVAIQWNSKKINYEKWYADMAKKYEMKNWIKFGLSALGYNLMANSWIFSYLVGLLGLLILTDLTYFFNITSALQIMKIVFGLYTWSSIVVVLIFFSQVQEWIVGWLKDLQNLNWGIDKQ